MHDALLDDALDVQLRDEAHRAQRALLGAAGGRGGGVLARVGRGRGGARRALGPRGRRGGGPALKLLLARVEQDAAEGDGLAGLGRGSSAAAGHTPGAPVVRVRREVGDGRGQVVAQVGVERDKGGLGDRVLEQAGDRAPQDGGRGDQAGQLAGQAVKVVRGQLVQDAFHRFQRGRGRLGVGSRCAAGAGAGAGGAAGLLRGRGRPGGAADVGRLHDLGRAGPVRRGRVRAGARGRGARPTALRAGAPVALVGRRAGRGQADGGGQGGHRAARLIQGGRVDSDFRYGGQDGGRGLAALEEAEREDREGVSFSLDRRGARGATAETHRHSLSLLTLSPLTCAKLISWSRV